MFMIQLTKRDHGMNVKQKAIEKIKKSNLDKDKIDTTIHHIKEWYIEDITEEKFYKELVKKFPFLKLFF